MSAKEIQKDWLGRTTRKPVSFTGKKPSDYKKDYKKGDFVEYVIGQGPDFSYGVVINATEEGIQVYNVEFNFEDTVRFRNARIFPQEITGGGVRAGKSYRMKILKMLHEAKNKFNIQ